ncbi:contractile injection system tape measure protein [Methylomonas sp. MgM2]
MTHLIRAQHWQVEFNGPESDALALQRRLAQWCNGDGVRMLERSLDKYVPDAEYWVVDSLELDAGSVDLERLEDQLAAQVGQALEQALPAPRPLQPRSPPQVASTIRQQSPALHLDQCLAYFLSTGMLPWTVRLAPGEHLEHLLLNFWEEQPSNRIFSATLASLASASARRRLVLQFTEAFLAELLDRLTPARNHAVASILSQVHGAGLPAAISKAFRSQLWETLFASIAAGRSYSDNELDIVRAVWRQLPEPPKKTAVLTRFLASRWPAISNADGFDVPPPSTDTTASKAKTDHKRDVGDEQSQWSRLWLDSNGNRNEIVLAEGPENPIKHAAEATQGFYIDNAGLVLLHPFLPQFFQSLALVNENTVVQPARACCLLHYLATGRRIAPEYELILPKVLCNIPLTQPVEPDADLTPAETAEAEALLAATIQHWEALKNTGIDALRGAFLLRAGKMTLRDDGDWLLQVENKGLDILLAQLPWGIGVIKLPWMESMLWVEWPV